MIESNHMLKIVIYSNNNEIIKRIARSINSVFKNGVINDTNWEKISKKFKVNIDQCIAAWKMILQ
ncbi:MAG TPA: hypothetical protein VMZ29_13925 [Candidatus Bathyarchaeia archaeon]|nr:hypothetical protein [Candidatus Bathyarchaeia archaeon]